LATSTIGHLQIATPILTCKDPSIMRLFLEIQIASAFWSDVVDNTLKGERRSVWWLLVETIYRHWLFENLAGLTS